MMIAEVRTVPYLVEITHHREGQPIEPVTSLADAQEAASMLSPLPDAVEPIDAATGHWNVELPESMVAHAWETGIYLDLMVGGFRFRMDMDPS